MVLVLQGGLCMANEYTSLTDEQCTALGNTLGRELSVHQLRLVLEGLVSGHYEIRAANSKHGDAMLGPDKHFMRAAEMLGCMEARDTQRQMNG